MNLKANIQNFRKTPKGLLTNLYSKMKERNTVSFSLNDFHSYLKNRKFNELFKNWVKSGFSKEFKPSVDRINFLLPYTLENIRFITWKQNRLKGDIEVGLQKKKPVIMFCLNGKFVHQFDSIESVVRFTGYRQSQLSACCNGKRNKVGDFKFKLGIYENKDLLNENNK